MRQANPDLGLESESRLIGKSELESLRSLGSLGTEVEGVTSQGHDLELRSRHELHQDSPYGQQTKGHSNNSGIGAHRAVSCLDRARMTKAALSRCEMVHGPWSILHGAGGEWPSGNTGWLRLRSSQGRRAGMVRSERRKWGCIPTRA